MKIAVVSNQDKSGVINRYGQDCPEKYSMTTVKMVVDTLNAAGYVSEHIEADKHMLANLERFMPADPVTGQPTGMVFNMAYGIQGADRYTHVPAMLEMAGVPYTGSTPLGHSVALDKAITKILIRDAGVPTPNFAVFKTPEHEMGNLRFPLVVKPLHESTSFGLHLVHSEDELRAAVKLVIEQYLQPALVEEYVAGREFNVGLLGDRDVQVFPPLELDFGTREFALMTWGDKFHQRPDEPQKVCPAKIDDALTRRLQQIAIDSFRACHLRDYARVDLRIDRDGNPQVLEINSMASLGGGGSYMYAAKTIGYTPQTIILRIVEIAVARCPALARETAAA